jgi:hypothetical protein
MFGLRPKSPVFVANALPDPSLVRRLVEVNAPYFPVQRYFANQTEYDRVGGGAPMIIAPNFRGDWAYDEPLIDGVEPILHNPRLIDAARQVFGGARVRPQIVYANLTWQLPFPQGGGHTDVTAYRGIDRTRYPLWLLGAMHNSGLFEAERVNIVTAVAWFYRGKDGGFTYWPEGRDGSPQVHEGTIDNTAIVGDNDFMFHRVNPVGDVAKGLPRGLTLDTCLARIGGDRWAVVDDDVVIGELDYAALRISVSWKAMVFRDEEAERLYDTHSEDLDLPELLRRFARDLESRGMRNEIPPNPLESVDFVALLNEAYPVRTPESLH